MSSRTPCGRRATCAQHRHLRGGVNDDAAYAVAERNRARHLIQSVHDDVGRMNSRNNGPVEVVDAGDVDGHALSPHPAGDRVDIAWPQPGSRRRLLETRCGTWHNGAKRSLRRVEHLLRGAPRYQRNGPRRPQSSERSCRVVLHNRQARRQHNQRAGIPQRGTRIVERLVDLACQFRQFGCPVAGWDGAATAETQACHTTP